MGSYISGVQSKIAQLDEEISKLAEQEREVQSQFLPFGKKAKLEEIQKQQDSISRKKNIADRNMNADADIVVELYDKRTKLVTDRQSLQEKRNANAQAMKQKLDSDARQKLIDEGRKIKDDLAAAEKELAEIETNTFNKLNALLSYVNTHSEETLKLSEIIHLVIQETEDTYNIEINDYVEAYKSEFNLDTNPYAIDVINHYKDIKQL